MKKRRAANVHNAWMWAKSAANKANGTSKDSMCRVLDGGMLHHGC